MRISDWSSEVCASDLLAEVAIGGSARPPVQAGWNIPRVMADRQSATASSLSCLAAQDRMSDAEFIVDMMMWLARRGLTFFAAPSRTESTSRPEKRSVRSEEHTSELQSLMRISYACFCLKNKTNII